MKNKLFQVVMVAAGCSLLFWTSCKKESSDPGPSGGTPSPFDPGPAPGDLGSVTFNYGGNEVVYTTVRAKDGHIWLQQNLGAKKVAASATDEDAYGDLYQWGRWTDGHQNRSPEPPLLASSNLSANNPSGLVVSGIVAYISSWWGNGSASDTWAAKTPSDATSTNGCDPCRALGDGWSLPTDNDWTNLLNKEDITNTATAFNSNMKIPRGGWRSINSLMISGAGLSSWYWSSTATSSAARGVWITDTEVHKSYTDSRAYGTSIRCIKKQ